MSDEQNEMQQRMIDERKPQTFDEISSFLLSRKNCRVNGNGFIVLDLHECVNKTIELVELIPIKERKQNLMCITSKRLMERIFDAFLFGDIEQVGTVNAKIFGSIYGT